MADVLELVDPRAPRAEAIWRDLERRAHPPYFLTWGWVSTWLAMLPGGELPTLAVIRGDDAAVAACFLGRRRLVRHHVVPSRALFVNATGIPRYDELCVEHNGLLGARCTLARLVAALPRDWDELFLPAVDRTAFRDLELPRGYHVQIEHDVPAPFVDLERVRAAGDYLAVLSANTRAQLRRARRRVGPCELEVARTVDDALAIYDELVALHGATWRARGEPGAFADPWFQAFHRRLITDRFAHGELQLLRLRHGGGTLGCLYNLVASGRVAFYQSGLASSPDPVVKPGLLCHAAAIEHCAAAGHAMYDLLAGSARYKLSLATGATQLVWLRVQRAHLRFAIEQRVRAWKHTLAGALA
jgi:CelD/BcsL family acetyltransferase involved in cellulose biosynthesis